MQQYTNPLNKKPNTYSIEKTPVYNNRSFKLAIVPGGYGDNNNEIIDPVMNNTITGILDDIPSINISTEWEVAGIAKLDAFVKKYADNSMIKTFSQLGNNYMTPVSTDGWTQQFPKKSCLINFDLGFRSYYENIYNTLNYRDIIKILTYATAPKRYSITDSLENIAVGGDKAIEGGKEFVKLLEDSELKLSDFSNSQLSGDAGNERKEELAKKVDKIADKISAAWDKYIEPFLTKGSTGGCSRFKLSINNYLSDNLNLTYFYVTSWSFTPSSETIFNGVRHCPAYVDFKITVETDRYINDQILNSMLIHD